MQKESGNGIAGKTAIVTGGTRGIGYAIARMLLERGAQVAICARSQEGVDKAVASLQEQTGKAAMGWACDVASEAAIAAFYQKVDEALPKLDILINNAGIGIFKPVGDMTPAEWRATLDTNLTGVFYFTHLAVERFKRTGGGFIVNLSSLAGRNPFAGGAAYNASKFGLNGFTEALMLDHRNDNVRVCSVMPGSVATDFGGPGGAGTSWKIQPEDIAEVVRVVLEMPERTMVSRVEIRPSRPGKS
ncbi:MAG: SDR family oxidoreductase [Bryobacterales bacterium]|nr:SDR family oxidoreductase [Bryobacterales bacterium]